MITTCLIGVVVGGLIAYVELLRNREVINSAAIVVVRIFVIVMLIFFMDLFILPIDHVILFTNYCQKIKIYFLCILLD